MNLKQTVSRGNVKQSHIADFFGVRPQRINTLINSITISPEWKKKLETYFKKNGIDIIE
jgi:plasmid maintenance system antidote protein VapI